MKNQDKKDPPLTLKRLREWRRHLETAGAERQMQETRRRILRELAARMGEAFPAGETA